MCEPSLITGAPLLAPEVLAVVIGAGALQQRRLPRLRDPPSQPLRRPGVVLRYGTF